MTKPKLWIYKCNRASEEEGDWSRFMNEWAPGEWGGTHTTKDPVSLRILRENMGKSDLVLGWQVDSRKMMGLCQVTKLEKPRKPANKEQEVYIHLRVLARFEPPIDRRLLPDVPALTNGSRGMLRSTTTAEAKQLLRACKANRWTAKL